MRKLSHIKFKWLNIFIIFLSSISLVGCSSLESSSSNNADNQNSISAQITESTVITFSDKNLEQAIREEIQCPTGDILKGDVNKITNLQNAQDKHITNLSGIENLANLDSLNLSNNQIKNIEPLKGLTNLTDLNLAANQMSNIEPLKELTNLTKLDLATNQISNIEPLKGLTNLTNLDLASNQMITIEPLKGFADLTNLNLASNKIQNYLPVNTYYKTLARTDNLNTVIDRKPKSIMDINQALDNVVIMSPDVTLDKVISGTIQHPIGDILNSSIEKIPYPQKVEDNNITSVSSLDNLTNLDINQTNNIVPLK